MNTHALGPREVNAVATTGIYCRAGCAARPLPANCSTFRSAVAAEAAGYRPCLKCRPDRRRNELLDGNTPDVVKQALMLISDGELDDGGEDALGQRIGISARQLRRLFKEHIGATPALVARSRRTHFARRLLDESDLPVHAISDAAGFRSVRQMNRVVREVFRFTPMELRAKRRASNRPAADGGLRLRIPYPGGFDFTAMLSYLAPRAIPGVESVSGGVYRRVTNTCGYPGAIEVSSANDGAHLDVVAHLPTYANLVDDVARCKRLLGLDVDLSEGRSLLAADPMLGPLVAGSPALTLPGAWDRFETAVRIIVGQHISVPAASTITGRITARCGTAIAGLEGFGLGVLFPSAGQLAEADLSGLGMPAARASTVRGFAAAVAGGSLNLYDTSPLPELVQRLQDFEGIGPWTANVLALRVYGHLDAFPAGDLGLRKAVARLPGGESVSTSALERMAERWRPWRSLAAVYLWESLAAKN
ncbi:MAG: DNA-3-methyladenine glycosylase 2 family protein [SAR202 cluster bacterium]|nr:DNA-3-methyladenine glycosylase 2 family protein [SAR202 cluster bacterium]